MCNYCKTHKNKICKTCGQIFISNNKEKYCSDYCKLINKIYPTLIKYFNLNKSVIGTINIFNEIDKIKNNLFNLYWIEHKSGVELEKIFNYPAHLTQTIFKYLNIPTRNLKLSNLNSYLTGKHKLNKNYLNNYKSGWHTTWNNKQVYLRSSYELDYAKQLDDKKINYEVETLHIKYLNSKDTLLHVAIPDFYLPEQNLIVEIKSNWTFNKQEMIDKFIAYKNFGYNCKLILEHKEVDLFN